MRPTLHLFKSSSGSSNRWLARQTKDPYVRLRTSPSGPGATGTETYRARSAFKLISLSTKYPSLLGPGKVVVDLGAAPGGWSQVAVNLGRGGGRGRVIAVDIHPMGEIPGVEVLKGDFLSTGVRKRVEELVRGLKGDKGEEGEEGGKVDTVLSDMMAPMSGVRDRDVQASLDLCGAAAEFGRGVLEFGKEQEEGVEEEDGEEKEKGTGKGMVKGRKIYPGGNMVLKFFAHPDLDIFKREELEPWFAKVAVEKPKESRAESSEAYFVCLGFKGPPFCD